MDMCAAKLDNVLLNISETGAKPQSSVQIDPWLQPARWSEGDSLVDPLENRAMTKIPFQDRCMYDIALPSLEMRYKLIRLATAPTDQVKAFRGPG